MLPETYNRLPINREKQLGDLRALLRTRQESFVATLVVVHGTAEVTDPAIRRSRPVEGGVRLARGMSLTVKTGRAMVRLDDGSDLWLQAGATLDLSPWSERFRTVKLAAGRLLALIAKESARPFRILAPQGEVLVTGTAFALDAHNDFLNVMVLHGSVTLSNEFGALRLVRSQSGRSSDRKAPAPAESPRKEDWAWLGDTTPSAVNERVGAAYRAAVKELGLPKALYTAPAKRSSSRLFGGIATLALLLALGGAGVYMLSWSNDSAETVQDSPAAATTTLAQPVTSAPGRQITANVTVTPQQPAPGTGAGAGVPFGTAPTTAPGAPPFMPSSPQPPAVAGAAPPDGAGQRQLEERLAREKEEAAASANAKAGHLRLYAREITAKGEERRLILQDEKEIEQLLKRLPTAESNDVFKFIQRNPSAGETFRTFTWNDDGIAIFLEGLPDPKIDRKVYINSIKPIPPEVLEKIQIEAERIKISAEELQANEHLRNAMILQRESELRIKKNP